MGRLANASYSIAVCLNRHGSNTRRCTQSSAQGTREAQGSHDSKRCTANKFLPDIELTLSMKVVSLRKRMSRSIFRFPLRHPIGVGDRVNTKEYVLCEEKKRGKTQRPSLRVQILGKRSSDARAVARGFLSARHFRPFHVSAKFGGQRQAEMMTRIQRGLGLRPMNAAGFVTLSVCV